MSDPPDPRIPSTDADPWHGAINRFHDGLGEGRFDGHRRWMYEAKKAALAVPRLILLFAKEREGTLVKIHRQCSHSEPEPVRDNHLTCCLGVKCKECPELLALESANLPPESIDRMKAWTCAAHILSEGGDVSNEGYILTEDDRMFWSTVYANMAGDPPDHGHEDDR